MRNDNEWSAFANLLGNLIAKYVNVLDLESLPDPDDKREITLNTGDKATKTTQLNKEPQPSEKSTLGENEGAMLTDL